MVVLPCLYGVAHNLKKSPVRYQVPVVFSVPDKLARICCAKDRRYGCGKKHIPGFLDCTVNVVYNIPLPCSKSYIAQTGRYINDWAREHARTVRSKENAHLTAHCKACRCKPHFSDVRLLEETRTLFGPEKF